MNFCTHCARLTEVEHYKPIVTAARDKRAVGENGKSPADFGEADSRKSDDR